MPNRPIFRGWKLTIALILTLVIGNTGFAQKGGGGKPPADPPAPPAAPGTIYFEQNGSIFGANSDGSDVTLVIPQEVASQYYAFPYGNMIPSRRVYGPDNFFDRWWLGVKDLGVDPVIGITRRELVIFHIDSTGNVTEKSVTNAFPEGFRVAEMRMNPSWGPNDEFISFKALEFGYDPVLEAPFFIANHLIRIDLSLIDMLAETEDLQLSPTSPLWSVAATIDNGYEQNFAQHHWSPNGDVVFYSGDDALLAGTKEDLFVRDLDTGVVLKLWNNPRDFFDFSLAYDGTQILLNDDYSYGEILLLDLDGTETVLYQKDWNTGYSSPNWSPDSSQIVMCRVTRKGNPYSPTTKYSLVRASRTGGDVIQIPMGLDESVPISFQAWVTNDFPQNPTP